ncbi:Mbov_0396 family ICE element transmembrane protein, partial [Mycoplasmopsis pullorum]|uniref:Mbov_0396 family ICE element transmembrane protein n=1 Tax=Mycoplasmopsis pullorum TaxID=48003 RepID=UPI0015D60C13
LIVMGIFAVFVPAILLSLTVISIISKIFQLLLLFVLSPWINAYRVLDDGENVRKWWIMFSAKLNSIWIYLIVLQLYIFFINKVMSFIDSLQESFITLAFYRIIGVLGATVSFNAAGEIINSFFGDNLSLREGMSQIQQTAQLSRAVKGGVAIAGGIAAKTIITGVKLPSKIKAGVGFAQNTASNIRAFGTNLKNMKQQFTGVRQQFGQYREMLDQQGLNKSDKKSILNMMKQDKKDMYKSILTNPFKNNQLNKQMRSQELRNLYENNIKNLNTPSQVNNQLGEVDAD